MQTTDAAGTKPGEDRGEAVVTIGVFDGVHRGHQALLGHARAIAQERGLPLVVLTFDPHPKSVVSGRHPRTLATLEDRIALLRAHGADEVVVLPFTPQLAELSAAGFIDLVLRQQVHASAVVVGSNFRFGHRAAGDVEALRAAGAHAGFDVHAVALRADAEPWSSTRIRALLDEGDVSGAAVLLGRPYRLRGLVVHGDHRGRELGYPTANLTWAGEPVIPADGVYAGWLVVDGSPMASAISVGTNPQFDGSERRVEAYAIDRVGLDLYGEGVAIDFVGRLRGQMTFPDLQGLVDRMALDVSESRRILAEG
jgi:riboflavin kinase/FMN adenylyltransferase